MGQLIKATTTPLEVIRFSQNARLIPSSMVDVERRKVIARHNAFKHKAGSSSMDLNFVNRVNKTFSAKRHTTAAVPDMNTELPKISPQPSGQIAAPVYKQAAYNSSMASDSAETAQAVQSVSMVQTEVSFADTSIPLDAQSQAAYTAQRGAFEMRVAKGELSYVPAMVMTIITQLPQVHFEYIGGFNYVPPDWNEPLGANVNCSI